MTWMPTHVQLTVQRVRGLLTKGKHGTNDCFVVMSLGKEKFQTSVKEKAPPDVEWCEECELTIPKQGNTAEIKLTVLHRNFLGVDEFLGQTSVPLADQDVYERPRNRWYQLHSKPDKKDKKQRGELEVRLAFTVKAAAAPSVSSADLTDGRKGRGSLLSLPKVSGTLGGSLASLGQKKKSLRKLAASVGHKVAKVGGRRRGSSSRGTSEAGSDVGSDLGWDDGASSNADPGVISEGEEDMFGFDDDQGRRVSPGTPELHGRVQPRALLDETPLSSLSSSVQSGLSDMAHAATYEQPGEAAVRHEAPVAPSPLAATDLDEPALSGWPGSGRSSGRLRAAEPPHTAEVTAADLPRKPEVTSTDIPRKSGVTATELPHTAEVTSGRQRAPQPPHTTEVTTADLPRKTEVKATEPPHIAEVTSGRRRAPQPPHTTEVASTDLPRKTEVIATKPPHAAEVTPDEFPYAAEVAVTAPGGGAEVTVSPPVALTPPGGGSGDRERGVAARTGPAPPRQEEGAARPADQEALSVAAPQSAGAVAAPPDQDGTTEVRQEPQGKLGKMFRSLTSLKKEEEPAGEGRKEQEPATQKHQESTLLGAGEVGHHSARGVSARLSGRLRAAETSGGAEVRSAGTAPSDRADTGSRGQAGDHFEEPQKNPFEEAEKNPFEEPEKNSFEEPEKNPFEEPDKNPFEAPEKNPFEEPEKNPFEEPENNPFEEPVKNPFDEPDEDYEVEVPDVEESVKQPKEKNRKRDKLGKMFRGLKSKKEDSTNDSPEKKHKKSSQASDEPDSRTGPAGVGGTTTRPPAPTLRSVQTWAGALLPGAGPDDQPPLNPFEEEAEEEEPVPIPEEGETVSPVRERSGRAANLKERLRKRDKPEKAAAPSRKTPQIFRKSGNAPTSDHIEKARRQTTLPRSDSVPLLRMSADADWPRVVEGGNERLSESGRESHGPFDGVSRERLVEMITEMQRELQQTTDELKRSRAQTQDMEEYLDSLLARIMEISPQLLQSPTKPAAASTKYGARGS